LTPVVIKLEIGITAKIPDSKKMQIKCAIANHQHLILVLAKIHQITADCVFAISAQHLPGMQLNTIDFFDPF
jgi:hypothetical protein